MARAKKAEGGKVAVRVLVDCYLGRCGSVAELDPDDAERAVSESLVDDNPDAVAYALSEQH
jgi:hypothetical protein